MEREQGKRIKRFRTDNDLDFCNKDLEEYFKGIGIKHERRNVETPQMNGIAERINRTLLDMTRSMLRSACLPHKFWAEAVTTAAYVRNRTCHSGIENEIPIAVWTRRKPGVQHLKISGSLAYAWLPRQGKGKLDNRAVEYVFIGYGSRTRGFRVWCPEIQNVLITKHVRFVEHKIGYEWIYKRNTQAWRYNEAWSDDEQAIDVGETTDARAEETPPNSIEVETEPNEADATPRIVGGSSTEEGRKRGRPKKVIRNPYGRKGKPRVMNNLIYNDSEEGSCDTEIEANLVEVVKPQSVVEALNSPQASQWKSAMQEELDSLESRNTWQLSELPKDKKCIGCRWVFKLKTNAEGKVARYKARLVAQGFSQTKGIDYEKTSAPVVNFLILRILLALTVEFGWYTRHVDIKCAYLYGKLEEDIYMRLPVPLKNKEGNVAKLLRPIYGLKQSGRNWNKELNEFLIKQGFRRLQSTSCTYCKGYWTTIVIYVDDIFIFSNDSATISDIVREISATYEMKDFG